MKLLLQKKNLFIIVLTLSSFLLLFFINEYVSSSSSKQKPFLFYEEDPKISFEDSGTEIYLLEIKDEDEYQLQWDYYSRTSQPTSLRKDLSLLFENGLLVAIQSKEKNKRNHIENEGVYDGEDSGKHQAITFHYAETHYPKDVIKNKRAMSNDYLYIIDSPLSPIMSFKDPKTAMEEKSKELLDFTIHQQLTYLWKGLMDEFNINEDSYFYVPLYALPKLIDRPSPHFTKEKKSEVIGKVWQGLYQYYISGINTFTHEEYDPIGNSMPIILLHENGRHFIILYKTGEHVSQQIFQHLD